MPDDSTSMHFLSISIRGRIPSRSLDLSLSDLPKPVQTARCKLLKGVHRSFESFECRLRHSIVEVPFIEPERDVNATTASVH